MSIQVNISQPVKNIRALKLVLKINSKGMLVTHSSQFELGDEVILKFNHDLKLRGRIFKFSSNAKGQKGMIIEYLMLNPFEKKQLLHLLAQEQQQTTQEPEDQNKQNLDTDLNRGMLEKTVITPLNSLDHLALQSPDQNPNFVASTLDEEAQRSRLQADLAQKTRIETNLPKIDKLRQKRASRKLYAIVLCFTALVLLVAGIRKKQQTFEDNQKNPAQSIPNVVSLGEVNQHTPPTASDAKKTKPRKQNKTPKAGSAPPSRLQKNQSSTPRLSQLNFAKTPAFYKISIAADQQLSAPQIIRLSDPKRIRFDFKNTHKGNTRTVISVNDARLKQIKTQQLGSTTRLDIELNQRRFPRYDIKVYDRFADIFIYTL